MAKSNLLHSFSGQDFSIYAYFPTIGLEDPTIPSKSAPQVFGNLQTITTSLASSISQVQSVGSDSVLGLTTGSKIFAGSLVFSVLDKDPLQKLLVDAEQISTARGFEFFTIDQLPSFNVVIHGSSEYLDATDIYKLIVGVKLLTHGETISVDDFFTEQTYQYQAKVITPWRQGTPDTVKLDQALRASAKRFEQDAVDSTYLDALAKLDTLMGPV